MARQQQIFHRPVCPLSRGFASFVEHNLPDDLSHKLVAYRLPERAYRAVAVVGGYDTQTTLFRHPSSIDVCCAVAYDQANAAAALWGTRVRMTALNIFVSHNYQDNELCVQIVRALREAGADVWYDEDQLGSGLLMEVIQRELGRRTVVIVILSKAAFASKWVHREAQWAYELADRDPTRIILPVTASPIERSDFSGENGWLFLADFKRIELPSFQPFPLDEAPRQVLLALALTPKGEAPTQVAPQALLTAPELLFHGKGLRAQGMFQDALLQQSGCPASDSNDSTIIIAQDPYATGSQVPHG